MISFAPWQPRRAPLSEAAVLAQRVARGDRAALALLYRSEAGAVYRYVLALCGNPGWAADATQDAFIAFAEKPHGFDARRGSIGAYLAGAARHALLAQRRRQREELDGDGEHGSDGDESDAASPETLLVRAEATHELWAALRRLPIAFREAVVLVDLQERPYAEAAAIAGVELNTLRTRLHRGRLRLAVLLGARPGESE